MNDYRFAAGINWKVNRSLVVNPFYWNIHPQMDATLTPNYMSKRGTMLESEFRYLTQNDQGQIDYSIRAMPARRNNRMSSAPAMTAAGLAQTADTRVCTLRCGAAMARERSAMPSAARREPHPCPSVRQVV